MNKRNKTTCLDIKRKRNPVAKFATQFNKASVFNDKRAYRRKPKHPGQEPYPMLSLNSIG